MRQPLSAILLKILTQSAVQRLRSADDFLDLCSLAGALSEVVELCSSDLTTADNSDIRNVRRMKRPCLLNAYTVGHLADRECFAGSAALTLHNNALEDLNSFAAAFLDLTVYTNCIAYAELRSSAVLLRFS